MKLCKHARYKLITHIKDPKWTTKEILIDVHAVDPNVEHYIIQFSNDKAIPQFNPKSAKDEYGWFYMGGAMIRRHKKQRNGNSSVYVVPMSKREVFEKVSPCEHDF